MILKCKISIQCSIVSNINASKLCKWFILGFIDLIHFISDKIPKIFRILANDTFWDLMISKCKISIRYPIVGNINVPKF